MNPSAEYTSTDDYFNFRIRMPLLILLCILMQPVLNVFLVVVGLAFFVMPMICGALLFVGLGGRVVRYDYNGTFENTSSYDSLTTQQQTHLNKNRYNAIKNLLADCSMVSWITFV